MFHISRFKRNDKNGIHLGGVEKFAHYLQMVFPDLQLVSWEDCPDRIENEDKPDYDKASILNGWLLEEGLVGSRDTVIVDGYWGLGLQGKVGRLISVCHGSYFGRYVQSLIYPWGETVDPYEIDAQEEAWSECEIVAVSESSWYELECLGLESTVIRHGVPLDIFRPLGKERHCYMHAAGSLRKGVDLISLLYDEVPDIRPMNERSGRLEKEAARLNEAMVILAPTRHEGNSYFLIEALACGTPALSYATGLATELDERCGIVTGDLSGDNWQNLIENTDWESFSPREWAEENGSLERFKKEWKSFL